MAEDKQGLETCTGCGRPFIVPVALLDLVDEGLSYDEAQKGIEITIPGVFQTEVSASVIIFLIVVAFVYLVLVGQYESFILPFAVIFLICVAAPSGIAPFIYFQF